MKKSIGLIFIASCMCFGSLKAQRTYFTPIEPQKADSVKTTEAPKQRDMIAENMAHVTEHKADTTKGPQMSAWKINTRSANRISTNIDRSVENFHRKSLVEGNGLAIQYTGNLGSPAQSQLFFERGESSTYKFLDMFGFYYQEPQDAVFYNVKVPYSNVYYQTGGGRNEKEERLKTLFTMNNGEKFNIGFNLDYIYSRGFYSYLSNKQFTYNIFTSYISDRYQMHAYVMNNYYNNSENGGISDDRFITSPNDPDLTNKWSRGKSSKDIPVNIERLWNKLQGRQVFISNKYDIGAKREITNANDGKAEFIPVASFILTNHYADQRRKFASKDETLVRSPWGSQILRTDSIYFKDKETYTDPLNGYKTGNMSQANDFMSYWTLKNTFAMTLNEGFKEWVKFGLTAFIEQDISKFALPIQFPGASEKHGLNSTTIGGMLSKQKGSHLRYNLKAELGVLGYKTGAYKLEGEVITSINIAGKEASIKAKAYSKSIKPTFYENNYRTKYLHWSNDFNNTKRSFIGGEINIPQTQTVISGGVEDLKDFIYYDTSKQIAQFDKNLQVYSVRVDQKLKGGIFHWDNAIAFQHSSHQEILPLPRWSIYSNIYIQTKLVRVLTIQLGADATFASEYYAQAYDPALLQFHNQHEKKVGNFPFVNAYLNLNLKNTRFFLMMYNLAEKTGGNGYFNTPHYPTAPMSFRLGISWDFFN